MLQAWYPFHGVPVEQIARLIYHGSRLRVHWGACVNIISTGSRRGHSCIHRYVLRIQADVPVDRMQVNHACSYAVGIEKDALITAINLRKAEPTLS